MGCINPIVRLYRTVARTVMAPSPVYLQAPTGPAIAGAARGGEAGPSHSVPDGAEGAKGGAGGTLAERRAAGCCGRDPLLAATLVGESSNACAVMSVTASSIAVFFA